VPVVQAVLASSSSPSSTLAKSKISQREFLLARAFLKGLNGNVQNTYLILAVTAWLRAMTKAHDPYWKSLSRLSAAAAGARLAAHLTAKSKAGKYQSEYKALIRRARSKIATGQGMADQAHDFILSIEKSHYDKKHYGYVEAAEGHNKTVKDIDEDTGKVIFRTVWVPPVYGQNPLYDAYAALTNHPNIPDKWWITTSKTVKVKVIPPRPHQPRSLTHVLPQPNYIQPYQAQSFYEAKPHYGDNLLLDPD
jgi:hypothetical protein